MKVTELYPTETKKQHCVEIYTDGSAIMRPSEKIYEASSACIIYIDSKLVYEGAEYHPSPYGTNSLGEVNAIEMGLYKMRDILEDRNILPEDCDIDLYSDSDYAIKSLNKYIKSWMRFGIENKWISYKSKEPVAYQDKWKSIYIDFLDKKSPFNVRFLHIMSHLDNDRSARKAWFKFMENNDLHIEYEDFIKHSKRNGSVDALAVFTRENKIDFRDRYDGEGKWENIRRIGNAIVIDGRKKNPKY